MQSTEARTLKRSHKKHNNGYSLKAYARFVSAAPTTSSSAVARRLGSAAKTWLARKRG